MILGETDFHGGRRSFGVREPARLAHMWVLGKTGSGKSTLLKNMIQSDLCAGRGLMLIDPHGDLADAALDLVPQTRIADTIYFNPADTDYPMAFNPLDVSAGVPPSLVAGGLIATLKKTWPEFWGPRMEYILRAALLTLLAVPGATLLDLHRLLVDVPFREGIVAMVKDPQLLQFWHQEFSSYARSFRAETVSPILNKSGQFLLSTTLRHILGQRRSSFSLRGLMDEGGVFIANLAKGRLGEDVAALLGSLLVSQLELAALTRVDSPEDKRRPFFLYVDEAHLVATRAMVDLFPEARKFGLGVILAHQYLEQLDDELLAAILGNVGTFITFRLGARDATALAKEFVPEDSELDLVRLPAYEAYVKLMVDGTTSRPFTARTFPPPLPQVSYRSEIVARTRELFSRSVAEVEEDLAREWSEPRMRALEDEALGA